MATTKKATSTSKKTAQATTTKKATATKKTPAKAATKPAKAAKNVAPEVTSSRVRKPQMVVGFVDFLREQSVVGLAIGLVIGTQTKALADQLIASFINPLIGLVLPGRGALDQKVFVLHLNDKSADFAWGSFVAVSLSFITTATVVYVVFKMLKLDKLTKKKDEKK